MKIWKLFLSIIVIALSWSVHAQETFQTLNKHGNEQVNNGNYAKALEYFDEALKVGSDDKALLSWTALLAATCAMQENKEDKVIEYNNIALQNGCEDAIVIDQQLELAKKYKDLKTNEDVPLLAQKIDGKYEKYTVKLLYFYYNSQQFNKTIEIANEVLKFNPNHKSALYFKGVALGKTGGEDEAIKLLNEIISKDPENTKVNLQLGLIYYNRASAIFDKANQKYNKIVKPDRVDYHNYRKEIEKSETDYKKCLPLLESAYATTPKKYLKDAIALTQGRLRQIAQE